MEKKIKKVVEKTTKKDVKCDIDECNRDECNRDECNRDERDRGEGKTISLQGTARIMTKMTDYGREQAEQSEVRANSQPREIKIINTIDGDQIPESLNTEDSERRIINIIRDTTHNARRIQPLPDDMRRDTLVVPTDTSTNTLKPEYQTRTARAIAVVRRTANNAWTSLWNFWHWNG